MTLLIRRLIVLSVVVLVAGIGLPLWYKLTTIYRAPLPADFINSMAVVPTVEVPVYIESSEYKFPDIHEAVQTQCNALLSSNNVDWRLRVFQYDENTPADGHIVHLVVSGDPGLAMTDKAETIVYFNEASIASNDLPFFITQALVEHTFAEEIKMIQNVQENDIKYHYDVSLGFVLLSGGGLPVSWDIEESIDALFTPFQEFLKPAFRFNYSTEIQYYGDLKIGDIQSTEEISTHIELGEVQSNADYKMVLYFPPLESPLHINSASARVPNWGVIAVNKEGLPENAHLSAEYLEPHMMTFINELYNLLDMPKQAGSPALRVISFKRFLIALQLSRTVKSLKSLLKLRDTLPNMAIPKHIMTEVNEAIELRFQAIEALNQYKYDKALELANKCFDVCERAFFDREMVQQNFFPQEHMIAVYMPLLGPVSIVTLMSLIHVFREKKEDGKDEKKQQ